MTDAPLTDAQIQILRDEAGILDYILLVLDRLAPKASAEERVWIDAARARVGAVTTAVENPIDRLLDTAQAAPRTDSDASADVAIGNHTPFLATAKGNLINLAHLHFLRVETDTQGFVMHQGTKQTAEIQAFVPIFQNPILVNVVKAEHAGAYMLELRRRLAATGINVIDSPVERDGIAIEGILSGHL